MQKNLVYRKSLQNFTLRLRNETHYLRGKGSEEMLRALFQAVRSRNTGSMESNFCFCITGLLRNQTDNKEEWLLKYVIKHQKVWFTDKPVYTGLTGTVTADSPLLHQTHAILFEACSLPSKT